MGSTRTIFISHSIAMLGCLAATASVKETVAAPGKIQLQISRPSIPREVRSLFIPLALGGFAGFSVSGLFSSLVPTIIQQVLQIQDNLVVGLSVAGFFVSSAIGQLLLGWLPSNRHLAIGCATLALGSLALWISITLATFPALAVATLLCGMGQGIVMRSGLSSVAVASPAGSKAAVTSALFVTYYLSTSVPIVLIGFGIPAIGISLSVACFASLVTLVSIITLGMTWSSRLWTPAPGVAHLRPTTEAESNAPSSNTDRLR